MEVLKLTIENLARIKRAEVEIKPLTIFFGRNNTNKSYMAHVVYGLVKYLPEVIAETFIDFLNETLQGSHALEVDNLLSEIALNLEIRIHESFRGKNRMDELKINGIQEYTKNQLEKVIELYENFSSKDVSGKKEQPILSYESSKKELIISRELKISRTPALPVTRANIVRRLAKNVLYFPASRTGFILAFDALITGIIRERYGLEKPYEKLTEPVIDFLVGLHRMRSSSKSLVGQIAKNNILNKLIEIIDGKIWIDKKTRQLYYRPKGARGMKKIEMHLTSSSVTELAPLYVFLEKNIENIQNTFLIIEEPEAHLHPENQIKIAELIVELVNMGAKVLITTHSDYILNAINICLQRFWADKKDKPHIDPEMVSAYLFKDEGKEVKVSPLQIEEYKGISFENFYRAVDILTREEEESRRKSSKG